MCEILNSADVDQRISELAKQSSTWFSRHRRIGLPMRFVLYVAESQSGSLKKYYADLLDDSLECLISTLPVLANRLAVEIGHAVDVPKQHIRPALGLIVYWLILAQSDRKDGLPDSDQMVDILNGILSTKILAFK